MDSKPCSTAGNIIAAVTTTMVDIIVYPDFKAMEAIGSVWGVRGHRAGGLIDRQL
jgi:hypothetical protein